MFDWLIVGGGLHGSFVARAIANAAPAARIAVIDPQGALDAWTQRAAACGMRYLRSSGAHHLGQRADALRVFAAARDFDGAHRLGYYRRPSRELFEAHAEQSLASVPRIAACVRAIERDGHHAWRVVTDTAVHRSARVVLALGPNAPYRPRWGAGLEHVYDGDFHIAPASARAEHVAVVGGGISGAQLALRYRNAGHAVRWITRTAPRAEHFDSDPCYAGRRCLAPFHAAPIAQRTALLAAARRPGTLPPDVHAEITAALASGAIAWRRGEIATLTDTGCVFANGDRLTADRVALATGFENRPEPGGLLERLVSRLAIERDADGHLFADTDLAIAPGLHILGRPASLQLGPMAGNIRGARLAGQRLAAIARRAAYRATG